MRKILRHIAILAVLELIAGMCIFVPVQAAGTLTRTPACGPPGTQVTLDGSGFTPNSDITITYDGVPVTADSGNTITNTSGSFAGVMITVPDNGNPTPHTITVSTDAAHTASQSFATPKITVSPTGGVAGSTVIINGTGFAQGDTGIGATFNGQAVTLAPSGMVVSQGIWNSSFDVPSLPPRNYTISAYGNITGAAYVPTVPFTICPFTITATAGANGSMTPGGYIVVNPGNDQTFSIRPADGYNIADVKVDNTSVGAVDHYTFADVAANHDIYPTFEWTGIFNVNLSEGWNLLSTPFQLETGKETVSQIFDQTSRENIAVAYAWGNGSWTQIESNFVLSPLTAICVQVEAGKTATATLSSASEVFFTPALDLHTGLNLIGPAPAFQNGSFQTQNVEQTLASIAQAEGGLAGYTAVMSPPHNQPGWTYTAGGDTHTLLPFKGYWINMENPDALSGFSTTPIVPGYSPAPSPGTETLKVGALLSSTGYLSGYDQAQLDECQAVVDIWNNNGGITVEGKTYTIQLEAEDCQSTADGYIAATSELIRNQSVKFIAGPTSSFGSAVNGVLTSEEAIVSMGYNNRAPSQLSEDTPYTFLGRSGGFESALAGVRLLVETYPHIKTVVFTHADDGFIPYVEPFVRQLLGSAGISMLGDTVSYSAGTEDFTPIATVILNRRPNAVFMIEGTSTQVGGLLKSIRQLGSVIPFCMSGPASTAEVLNIAGVHGTTFFSQSVDPNESANPPPLQELSQRITTRFGVERAAGMHLEVAGGLWSLLYAIQNANSLDPEVVKNNWEQMGSIPGTLFGNAEMGGLETYGIRHVVVTPMPYCRLVNGELSFIGWRTVSCP